MLSPSLDANKKNGEQRNEIQRGGGKKIVFFLLDYYHIKVIKVFDNASEYELFNKSVGLFSFENSK